MAQEVYFGGDYFSAVGKPGKEISVSLTARWNGTVWYIPSVYTFDNGVVLEICHEEKADVPLDFRYNVVLNGAFADYEGHSLSYGFYTPEPDEDYIDECEIVARQLARHYKLDPDKRYGFHRISIPFKGEEDKINSLEITLSAPPRREKAGSFNGLKKGDIINFTNPFDKENIELTVRDYFTHNIPEISVDERFDFPNISDVLVYTVKPETAVLTVKDCKGNAKPIPKPDAKVNPWERVNTPDFGIRLNPDNVTLPDGRIVKPLCAASSLRFDKDVSVEWTAVFTAPSVNDINIKII